jgi:hypothetical protein
VVQKGFSIGSVDYSNVVGKNNDNPHIAMEYTLWERTLLLNNMAAEKTNIQYFQNVSAQL